MTDDPRDVNDIPYEPMPPKDSFTFKATVPASDEPREMVCEYCAESGHAEETCVRLQRAIVVDSLTRDFGDKGWNVMQAVLAEVARQDEFVRVALPGQSIYWNDSPYRQQIGEAALAIREALRLRMEGK